MDVREFLGGLEGQAWQMLDALGAADRAFVRIDDAGRIIALTERAQDLLRQEPLRSLYEVLGELAARAIRIAIARHEIMRTRDTLDGRTVAITVCPGEHEHLVYLEPEQSQGYLLRDQLVEQRLRAALSVLTLDDPETRQRAALKMMRLLHEIELLQGRPVLPQTMKKYELGDLCADAVRFASRCTVIPIRTEGKYTPVVCDAHLIRMALYHLLTNAVLAPGTNEITVRWGSMPGHAWFEVADDGEVLSEDAFLALCTASERVGTVSGLPPEIEGHMPGLGLPAVCEIAMRHGGGLSLVGAPEGKAVRFTMPDDLPEDVHILRASKMVEEGVSLEETELSVLSI